MKMLINDIQMLIIMVILLYHKTTAKIPKFHSHTKSHHIFYCKPHIKLLDGI